MLRELYRLTLPRPALEPALAAEWTGPRGASGGARTEEGFTSWSLATLASAGAAARTEGCVVVKDTTHSCWMHIREVVVAGSGACGIKCFSLFTCPV
jgi:hypothetical protein